MRLFQSRVTNYRYFSIALFILTMMVIQPLSHGQSLGGIDFKTVKVDDLSDQEILGYIQQAEQRGLTQAQLEVLARQQGVSESEISKLRRRVEALRGGVGKNGGVRPEDAKRSGRTSQMDTGDDVFGALAGQQKPNLTEKQKRLFGFDLFQKQSLTFALQI